MQKNNILSHIVKLAFGALVAMTLTGCGKQPVSETQLKKDFENSDQADDLDISTFYIVDRRTNKKMGFDEVDVFLIAENDEATEICRGYTMNYVLYDQGWRLDDIDDRMADSWTAVPTKGPSDSLLEENKPISDYEIADSEYEKGYVDYYYYYDYVFDNCVLTNETLVHYVFDPANLEWYFASSETSQATNWDIDGTWQIVPVSGFAGSAALYNEDYITRTDITVENEIAHVHVYAVGNHPEYFDGDQYFDITLDYRGSCSVGETYRYNCPGYYPTTIGANFAISNDKVILEGYYKLERL